jgi:hypothetical protein
MMEEIASGTEAPPPGASRELGARDPSTTCPTCGAEGRGQPQHIYALGTIEPRFSTVGVQKELAQILGRSDAGGLTDRQALKKALSDRQNRYLVRQLCWVMVIGGIETYLLVPRDLADFDLLVEAVRPNPSPMDLDLVIGVRGPLAPPEACNGLVVPYVAFDQIYPFDRDALIAAIPRPKTVKEDAFKAAAGELLERLLQMTDNAGSIDEHRALNYLAVRYPALYGKVAEAHQENASLSAIDVRPLQHALTRRVVAVILSFTQRQTDVIEKFAVQVDVTEKFPFLVRKLTPYFDR